MAKGCAQAEPGIVVYILGIKYYGKSPHF